ncbi:MAG: hypothetical protein LBP87_10330 [Planctomycetaceae bacterium]|jgi:DNA repair exonuclease SbcCD ATPase subunit|nr:hypothetical protein [Planctomycetaceae bacterium]
MSDSVQANNLLQEESSAVNGESVSLMPADDKMNSNNGEKDMFDFEALKVEEKNQFVKDANEYQELLRSIARNECKLSRQDVLRIIERADADVNQLEADVQWRQRRDEKIAELKRVPEYRTQKEELNATLQTMRDDLQKVKNEYETKRYPLACQYDQLDQKIRTAQDYRSELFETCRNTNLKLEYETLQEQWDNRAENYLYERQGQIGDKISDAQSNYERAKKTITIDQDDKKRRYKEQIKSLSAEYEAIELKKLELAKKKAEHEAALEKLREQMIFA